MTIECPAVEVSNLSYAYNGGRAVLDIAELTVQRGEHVFIHGPSGCGKTTLLGVLAGILPVTSGRIKLLGRDLTQMSSTERDRLRGDHLGYIYQMFNLIPYLSVVDNITLPCFLSDARRSRLGAVSPRDAASKLAKRLNIHNMLSKPVTELSVGQQQRVAAARALIGAPECLIADEPTSALDERHRREFVDLLFAAAADTGATIIFVSHDQGLAPLFPRTISLPAINRAATVDMEAL